MLPRSPNLSQTQKAIQELPLDQQKALQEWLATSIQQQGQSGPEDLPHRSGREVVEQKHLGSVVYQLEWVRCGKPKCKCASGELHGPYWYAYQRQEGKLKSWYVGKDLPENSEQK